MATTTQAERVFTVVVPPPTRELPSVVGSPVARSLPAAASGEDRWALARDAAGGLLVLGTWAALWSWFLAATW